MRKKDLWVDFKCKGRYMTVGELREVVNQLSEFPADTPVNMSPCLDEEALEDDEEAPLYLIKSCIADADNVTFYNY